MSTEEQEWHQSRPPGIRVGIVDFRPVFAIRVPSVVIRPAATV
jgi:hypothetical protein